MQRIIYVKINYHEQKSATLRQSQSPLERTIAAIYIIALSKPKKPSRIDLTAEIVRTKTAHPRHPAARFHACKIGRKREYPKGNKMLLPRMLPTVIAGWCC